MYLNFILAGNDDIVTLSLCYKLDLLVNSQKRCDVKWHFSFWRIWVTWRRCVVRPQHMTANLDYFVFYIFSFLQYLQKNQLQSLLFTNSYRKKFFPNLSKQNTKMQSLLLIPLLKKNVKKIKCIGSTSPLVSLWLWEILIFSLFDQNLLIKLIWDNRHNSPPPKLLPLQFLSKLKIS